MGSKFLKYIEELIFNFLLLIAKKTPQIMGRLGV
jgi:hypothetical protein